MALSVGIVGLPNVGKSSLFQALTKKPVDVANYPFCTIDPNVGIVLVPDERLDKLTELFSSAKTIPTAIEFADIAGLVKGAHEGEGLGNQFLSHIRETDSIVHVIRAFEDSEVLHVETTIDPVRDIDIIHLELLMKDKDTVQKRVFSIEKEVKANKKGAAEQSEVLHQVMREINEGKSVYVYIKENPNSAEYLEELQLLTAKPIMYLVNTKDGTIPAPLEAKMKELEAPYIAMNIKDELEMAGFSKEEREDLGLESKLPQLIAKAYESLKLITFITTGPDETRAWTVRQGSTAPEAGGVIHSDFADKFIRAVVISWDKLIEAGGLAEAAAKGWLRTEGKDYVVQDGDVIEIKHG